MKIIFDAEKAWISKMVKKSLFRHSPRQKDNTKDRCQNNPSISLISESDVL